MNFTQLDEMEIAVKAAMEKEKRDSIARLDDMRRHLVMIAQLRGRVVTANNATGADESEALQ